MKNITQFVPTTHISREVSEFSKEDFLIQVFGENYEYWKSQLEYFDVQFHELGNVFGKNYLEIEEQILKVAAVKHGLEKHAIPYRVEKIVVEEASHPYLNQLVVENVNLASAAAIKAAITYKEQAVGGILGMIDLMKAAAFLKHLGIPFFEMGNYYFIGSIEATREKYDRSKKSNTGFLEWCLSNCTDIVSYYNSNVPDGLCVFTDYEADTAKVDWKYYTQVAVFDSPLDSGDCPMSCLGYFLFHI